MDVRFVEAVAGRPTLFSVCFQYPDGSGGNLTTSESAATALVPEDVDRLGPMLDSQAIALAAPEAPLRCRLRLLELGTSRGAFRAAAVTSAEVRDARAMGLFALVDLLSLNQDEAGELVGAPFPAGDPSPFLEACATALTALQPNIRVVVTAGRRGAWGFAQGRWDHCPALPVRVVSTAGAGDALLGGVLAALAAGVPFIVPGPPRSALAERPLQSALDLGACLAAFSVTSPHTIHPDTTLGTLTLFAREHGLDFAGELRRAAEGVAS
jgi:sugar/nucleoside kinase (ribokinase family)